MGEEQGHPLLIILAVAALAPLIGELPLPFRLPVVAVEVLLGMAVGPYGLDWLRPHGIVTDLSEMGLAALFFHAGLEIDFNAIRGRPLTLATKGWLLSLALAAAASLLLTWIGMVAGTWYLAIALTTTAIGTLLPILRDSGELETTFGRQVLASGALGEFGPVVLLSLLLSNSGSLQGRSALLVAFATMAAAACAIALRPRPPRVAVLLQQSLHTSSQLPIRLALLLVGSFFALAGSFGLDVVLGAFAAGMVVGLAAHGPQAEMFRHKLDALGFGFFIPIFFVMSGVRLDLGALAQPASLMRVPLFLALLLLVRGTPALLWRRELPARDCMALALYSATALPLLVAISAVGTANGQMRSDNAAALVGAGVLSVLFFPAAALKLRATQRTPP